MSNGALENGEGLHTTPKRPGMTSGNATVGSILTMVHRRDEGKANAKSGKLHNESRLESPSRGITTRVDGNDVSA